MKVPDIADAFAANATTVCLNSSQQAVSTPARNISASAPWNLKRVLEASRVAVAETG